MKNVLRATWWLMLILSLAACDSSNDPEQPTIVLAENPWTGSAVNVQIARILLEEQLDYTVDIVQIDEDAQWAEIATGDIHASLEVWPSGHADDIAEFIEAQGTVERGGPLGVVGRIGWWVPTYLVDQNPELATWEGFTTETTVDLFSTDATGTSGQFLMGDPSWVSYDEQIIENLNLDFEVVVTGSEEALLAEVEAAVSSQSPLLFYLWTPHAAHAEYDLTRVALPPYSDACHAQANSGGVDCDYPPDELFKIFATNLDEVAPEAYTLLSRMQYTTDQQVNMYAAVDIQGQTPEQAARTWLTAHEAQWRSWLP